MIQNPKARGVGLAAGSLWLIAIGGGFVAGSLFAIGPSEYRSAYAWIAVLAAALIPGTSILRKALHLPPDAAATSSAGRGLRKRFLLVAGGELAAFAIVNPLAALSGHFAMLAALNLIIIGVHFLPLASIFQVPRYYVMGILFCGISLATLLLMPKTELVGGALAWFVIPSAGCGLVATLIGVTGLLESRRIVADRAGAAA